MKTRTVTPFRFQIPKAIHGHDLGIIKCVKSSGLVTIVSAVDGLNPSVLRRYVEMNHMVGKESRPARGKQGRSPRLYIRGVGLMEVRKSNLWALGHSVDGDHGE